MVGELMDQSVRTTGANPGQNAKCEVCGKILQSRNKLVEHMRTHTGEKPYVCTVCGHCFRQKSHLGPHMLIHTGQKPHTCDICGMEFRRGGHLKVHKRKVHYLPV